MAQDPDQQPPLLFLARSGFELLDWRHLVNPQQREELEAWAGNLTPDAYADWYYWASRCEVYHIYYILRDEIVNDPRRTPPRVETRSVRARRLALQQEPDAVYRIRTSFERELPELVAQDQADEEWWRQWEENHPAEMEAIRRRDAEIAEEGRREQRRQRAAEAQAAFERRRARAQAAWARMRRYQAEVRADEQARERAGESSDSN